jgi:hypothetical protein
VCWCWLNIVQLWFTVLLRVTCVLVVTAYFVLKFPAVPHIASLDADGLVPVKLLPWIWCLLRVNCASSVMFQWVYTATLACRWVVGSWELINLASSVPAFSSHCMPWKAEPQGKLAAQGSTMSVASDSGLTVMATCTVVAQGHSTACYALSQCSLPVQRRAVTSSHIHAVTVACQIVPNCAHLSIRCVKFTDVK